MNVEYLNLPTFTGKALVLGDIHISSALSEEFEVTRIDILASKVLTSVESCDIIIFAGDTFDRNVPSLVDIRIFYQLVERLSTVPVLVVNGNHDITTFNFLPPKNFTYIGRSTIVNDIFMLTPYHELQLLETHLQTKTYSKLVFVGHARCNIPPYITEEISMELLSNSFKFVILGDIHVQPKLPQKNIMYTTSPSNVAFHKLTKNANGYIRYIIKTEQVLHTPISIPTKVLVNCKTFKEAHTALNTTTVSKNNYRKIRFSGTAEELKELAKYSQKNTVKDFALVNERISGDIAEDAEKLSEFLSSKVSLSEFAFNYFKTHLTIREDDLETIRQQYENLKTAKGSHR